MNKSDGVNGIAISGQPALPDVRGYEAREGRGPADDINRYGQRIQELLQKVEKLPDVAGRELVNEIMEAMLAFYGEGLARILQVIEQSGIEGRNAHADLINDEVVRGLLLIHDLHPIDLETRLREALDKVRPYLESHGGNVELISLKDDTAHLRLKGTCKSCASSAVTLELAIRHAIEEACPDLASFIVEGIDQAGQPSSSAQTSGSAEVNWTVIENVQRLAESAWMPLRVGEMRLVICKVNEVLYAYRNRCPACNMPFDGGSLDGGFLSCALGHHYDVARAGRCAEVPSAHLDPFPLLVQNGIVKVAVT